MNLPDNSITEHSDSTDTHSSGDDIALSATADTDQSEGFVGVERKGEGVAESALQDGEEEPPRAEQTLCLEGIE